MPAGFRACVSSRQIPRSESRYGIIGLAGDRSLLVPAGKFESEQACATRGVLTQVVSGLYKGFFI